MNIFTSVTQRIYILVVLINKVFLITGGESHNYAINFLKKKKYSFEVFDDNKNCFLKKKFKN